MLWMIVERFRNGDAVPVYRRFRERGRMAPDGLRYLSSWVTEDFTTCYQVMECDDRALLDAWIAKWRDLVDFEAYPVMTSPQAVEKIAPKL
jgi:Protein of unknown function (DUF3303)